MAAGRCNLTRRAVLGASVGVPLAAAAEIALNAAAAAAAGAAPSPFGLSSACPELVEGSKPVLSRVEGPCPSCGAGEEKAGLRQAQPERDRDASQLKSATARAAARSRWTRTLAAYRRAEARVAS